MIGRRCVVSDFTRVRPSVFHVDDEESTSPPLEVRRLIRLSAHKANIIIPITNNRAAILTSFHFMRKWQELYRVQQPVANLVPPESSLPVVPYDSHYTDDDKIDTNQVVEYLGENHNTKNEYKGCYSH